MPITCKRHSQINHAGAFGHISKLSIKFLVLIAPGGRFAINAHCAAEVCSKTSLPGTVIMFEDVTSLSDAAHEPNSTKMFPSPCCDVVLLLQLSTSFDIPDKLMLRFSWKRNCSQTPCFNNLLFRLRDVNYQHGGKEFCLLLSATVNAKIFRIWLLQETH